MCGALHWLQDSETRIIWGRDTRLETWEKNSEHSARCEGERKVFWAGTWHFQQRKQALSKLKVCVPLPRVRGQVVQMGLGGQQGTGLERPFWQGHEVHLQQWNGRLSAKTTGLDLGFENIIWLICEDERGIQIRGLNQESRQTSACLIAF